ncbi:MAG: hypothetical protein JNK81_00420 [Anaerolineales bacterium]|nr:hypothetical protein [Anaerolineales bacterium]
MSSTIKAFLLLIFLALIAFGTYQVGKSMRASLENKSTVNACPVVMENIIASSKGNVYEMDDEEDVEYDEPETYYLVTFAVNQNQIVSPDFDDSIPMSVRDEQMKFSSQKEAWDIFVTLIPPADRWMIAEYKTFTDGESNTLAAVDQTPDDLTQWTVEVDVADLNDKYSLIFTLVHEYAHLLTLNDTQASVDEEIYNDPTNLNLQIEKAATCKNYFTGAGCSYPDSYVNAFYNNFWIDVNDEWQAIDRLQYNEDGTELADDFTPYYNALFNFYLTHQDQFVDDYSTTHLAEDIAESFTYFVFSPKPVGDSIIDQKILFFYDYPELVELREYILSGTCSLFP